MISFGSNINHSGLTSVETSTNSHPIVRLAWLSCGRCSESSPSLKGVAPQALRLNCRNNCELLGNGIVTVAERRSAHAVSRCWRVGHNDLTRELGLKPGQF